MWLTLVRRWRRGGSEPCRADWRRDTGYWRCIRAADHHGRHMMRLSTVNEQVSHKQAFGRFRTSQQRKLG